MSKLLNILTDPDPILRKKSKNIPLEKLKSKEMQALCANMSITMAKKDGIGLAAPQIGKNIRLIVINTKDGSICLVNPKLIKKSWLKEWGDEGCLSVPNIFGQVRRHKKVICTYFDDKGKKNTVDAGGLFARVLQHEIDHLDGILFIDNAKGVKKLK